jgi:hypothetical protein
MSGEGDYWVEIKQSALEESTYLRRLLEWPDGEVTQEISYSSQEAAELDLEKINLFGDGEVRLQSAEHYGNRSDAILVSTGRSEGGYGRTTRNATSGWQYKRKQAIERDDFQCQECGTRGGPRGSAELHVNHIEPQSEGGSDGLANLETLCRECHMHLHEIPVSRESVSIDQLIGSIDRLARRSPTPAFTHSNLYFWLKREIESKIEHDLLREATRVLVRFGRFSATKLDNLMEYSTPWDDSSYKSGDQITVFYLKSVVEASELELYDGELRYGGEPVHHGSLSEGRGRQSGLDDFE